VSEFTRRFHTRSVYRVPAENARICRRERDSADERVVSDGGEKLSHAAVDDDQVPTRADVEERWQPLVEGRTSRNDVHAWAAPWAEFDPFDGQPLVETGLQSLHGFDLTSDPDRPSMLTHGGDGAYVHSDATIAAGLVRSKRYCAEHDADPEGWRQRRIADARKWIAENE
jgi:hypothetical protein